MKRVLSLTVHGTPQPAGSKRAFVRGGHASVVDANPKAKGWKGQVAQVAGEAWAGKPLLTGPLCVAMAFVRVRPKGHHGKSGLNAKGRRTPYPIAKPDVLKLARAVEDALTGVVWKDDAQIVDELLKKEWGKTEFVAVEVWDLTEDAS